jgi:hypothetical protein
VVLGALHDGVTVWEQAKELPGYLSDTFLHQRLGHSAPFQKSLRDVVLDGLPVDVALLVGGTVLGVVIGLATGLVSGARRRSPADRALSIGTALAMSAPDLLVRLHRPHALRAAVGLPGPDPLPELVRRLCPVRRGPAALAAVAVGAVARARCAAGRDVPPHDARLGRRGAR